MEVQIADLNGEEIELLEFVTIGDDKVWIGHVDKRSLQ